MDYFGPNVLARIFLSPAANIAPFTGPSTKLEFRMGLALTADVCSVVWAMQQERCTIEVQPRYVSRVDEWRKLLPPKAECKAKITLMPPNQAQDGPADVSVAAVNYSIPPEPAAADVASAVGALAAASPLERYLSAWDAA